MNAIADVAAAAALLRALIARAGVPRDRILLTRRAVDRLAVADLHRRAPPTSSCAFPGPDSREVVERHVRRAWKMRNSASPGMIVADIAVVGAPRRALDGSTELTIEALTIGEGLAKRAAQLGERVVQRLRRIGRGDRRARLLEMAVDPRLELRRASASPGGRTGAPRANPARARRGCRRAPAASCGRLAVRRSASVSSSSSGSSRSASVSSSSSRATAVSRNSSSARTIDSSRHVEDRHARSSTPCTATASRPGRRAASAAAPPAPRRRAAARASTPPASDRRHSRRAAQTAPTRRARRQFRSDRSARVHARAG